MKRYACKELFFFLPVIYINICTFCRFFSPVRISYTDQETYLLFFLIQFTIKMSPEKKHNERKSGYRNSFRVQ